MDKKELIMHLFIGKVADIIGIEETTRLLEEANEAFEEIEQEEALKVAEEKILYLKSQSNG